MSILCRLRKVLLSSGVSMLDGCGTGSHIRTAQVSGGSLKPQRTRGGQLLYIFRCPVQCSTWGEQQEKKWNLHSVARELKVTGWVASLVVCMVSSQCCDFWPDFTVLSFLRNYFCSENLDIFCSLYLKSHIHHTCFFHPICIYFMFALCFFLYVQQRQIQ